MSLRFLSCRNGLTVIVSESLLAPCRFLLLSIMMAPLSVFYFFSSRRQHTRYWRDWSLDVCSSDLGFSPGEKVVTIATILVLLPLVIAVHEAGHLLGGRLAGFRALLFVVGPFRIERSGEGFRADRKSFL